MTKEFDSASASDRSGPHYRSRNGGNSNILQQQNDERVDGLYERVSILKEISIGIGDELDEQKRFLNTFGEDMENTGGLLSGTMQRFRAMAATQNGSMMLYMGLFVVCTFMFMYLYVRFLR